MVVKVRSKGERVQITVIDNGCGLPNENRDRLVEPYMTTRAKGTGLGSPSCSASPSSMAAR